MIIDWIKRAWRGWFGPKVAPVPSFQNEWDAAAAAINKRAIILKAAREATIAQKNVRLASIARTRDAVKREIARLKRNKKKHSHMMAELARLTRLELELESGK